MDIGKNIATVRQTKGLTQVEMAKRLEKSLSNYSRFEKRGNGITVKNVLEIANAMQVSPLVFFEKNIEQQPPERRGSRIHDRIHEHKKPNGDTAPRDISDDLLCIKNLTNVINRLGDVINHIVDQGINK